MSLNRRSRLITQGVARSPNRAMLRAVGFGDGDFEKPIVGVANGHSTMNPCNAGIQPLVDRAMAALHEQGAMPQVFGVPTVTDGIGMGTEGMKYSLVSREVIADAIETSVNGQCMDGVLVVGGCDKNMPAGMMAMARINVPGIYVYAGSIKPGKWKGQDLTVVSVFESVGAFAAGKLSKEDYDGIEHNACPTVGACGGMFTANTMSSSFEALGMSLLGSSQMASPDPEKADSAEASARVLVEAIKKDLKPRDIITRKSIENAIALVMATGGSTNAVLHYLAIAAAAEVEWTIDDFERVRQRVPVFCNLKPSGKYVAVDFHRAGGARQVHAPGVHRQQRCDHLLADAEASPAPPHAAPLRSVPFPACPCPQRFAARCPTSPPPSCSRAVPRPGRGPARARPRMPPPWRRRRLRRRASRSTMRASSRRSADRAAIRLAGSPSSTPVTSRIVTVDTTEPRSGARSLRIDNIGPEPYGAVAQSVKTGPYVGKVAKLTAWMRTRDAKRQRRGAHAAGARGERHARAEFHARPAGEGHHPWTRYTLTLPIARNADSVEVGAMMRGKGSLWLDDVGLEFVDP